MTLETSDLQTDLTPRFFAASPRATWLAVILIFILGLGIRLFQFSDPPLEFNAARQLRSMFIARGMYYETAGGVPEWQREMAAAQYHAEGLIEPQIMERLSAWGYRLAGSPDLRIPRILAILFWSIGGFGLFLLTRSLTDANGGVIALAFYMTLPFTVMASRAFMPEPLLIASIIWAWWAMLRWSRNPGWKTAVTAGLLSGLAIFIKLTAVFFIAGAWIGLLLAGLGLKKTFASRQVWLMAFLTILPYALYHLYAAVLTGQMAGQFSLRFFPAMWSEPRNYFAWLKLIDGTIGEIWLLIAVVGFFLLREKSARGLFLGSLAGYGLYGMVFMYYITTHDYYGLPLVPMTAVGVAAAAAVLFSHLKLKHPWGAVVLGGVMILPMMLSLWIANTQLRARDFDADVKLAEQVGALFKPGDKVVSLAPYSSGTLRYWGWVNSTNWFSSADFALRAEAGQNYDIKALFDETTAGMDYFLVMNFDELNAQPELKAILENGYPLTKQTPDYFLYDLRQPLTP